MNLLLLAHMLRMAPASILAFSGEDPVSGNPWHHEAISEEAATQAGFSAAAADEIAWHADYVDSYLYNPLWWGAGGIDRLKVALSTRDELAKLHFDDLFSADHVRRTWLRYLSGAIAGLLWAGERNDVSAARNILGASLHAVQDFYSHSSWVNDRGRWQRTWFETPVADRDGLVLWTGAYELPEHLGVEPHGKYAPACAVLTNGAVSAVLEVACSVFSPLNKSGLCQTWRACQQGQVVRPETILGVKIPDNVVYLEPPGIALDNTWLAEIAVERRGLAGTGVKGAELFAVARELAKRSSFQWLDMAGRLMGQAGLGAFWQRVKSDPATGTGEREYEQYNKFPYMFLSAGPYPPDTGWQGDEYYLRVRLKTSADANSGTDSDIYLHAGGKSFLLDYMPGANPVIAHNDFEAGDDEAYVVGPFSSVPASLALENRSAGAGEVLSSLGHAFVGAVESLIETVGDVLLSIIAGHADLVGNSRRLWTAEELAGIGAAPQPFTVTVRGGEEGEFRVHGSIRRTQDIGDSWAEYAVRLDTLHCVKESRWDRGSSSDEPFVLALLVPLPGDVQRYRTEPYSNVDSGESRGIGHEFAPVRVPKRYGMLSLPISVMEHDDESRSARDKLLNDFANTAEAKTGETRRDFLTTLGAAVAEDWKLESLEVYAFARGGTARAGTAFNGTVNRWIRGKERAEFALNPGALRSLPLGLGEIGPSGPAWTDVKRVPGWFGAEDQGGGVAVGDINGNGRPDIVVFHIDNPGGDNAGYYRVGWDLDAGGDVRGGWTDVKRIPGWFGWENQGGDIALADISGNGLLDLVVFHIDNPGGENGGYYRIGWNLDAAGNVTGGWTEVRRVPGWFGAEDQGAGVTVADINGNGRPDLLVFHIDNPGGENAGYYRIGWDLDAAGNPTGGWSDVRRIPGWFGAENQGGSVAVARLAGAPALVVFHIDNPGGENAGYYRIGSKLDAAGNVTGGWSEVKRVPGWFGAENQGGGIALADVNGSGTPDLIVFHVDNPGGENAGYYRVGWNP